MKSSLALCLVICAVAAVHSGLVPASTTLLRAPSFDTAIIKSDRLGGNFAYSTYEGHAYAAVSPLIQPVLPYAAHQIPLGYAYTHQPFLIAQQPFYSPLVAAPVGHNPAAIAPQPAEDAAPQQPQADPAAAPAPGQAVDEDSVAVDSA